MSGAYFGVGFQQAMDDGRHRRAEVAQLFDEYRKRNPGATAEDMWRFVENMSSGTDLYLRGSLPTKQAMQSMEQDETKKRQQEEARQRLDQVGATLDMQDKFKRQLKDRMIWEDDPEKAMADALDSLGYRDDPEFRSQAYSWIGNPRRFHEEVRSEYELGQQGRYSSVASQYMNQGIPVPDNVWSEIYSGQPQYVIDRAKQRYEHDLSAQSAENERRRMQARAMLIENPSYVSTLVSDPEGAGAQSVRRHIEATLEAFTTPDRLEAEVDAAMAELRDRADAQKYMQSFQGQEQQAQKMSEQLLAQAKLNATQAKSLAPFAVDSLGITDPDQKAAVTEATTALIQDFYTRYVAATSTGSEIGEDELPYHLSRLAAQAVSNATDRKTGAVNLGKARDDFLKAAQTDTTGGFQVMPHRQAADLARSRASELHPIPRTATEFLSEERSEVREMSLAHGARMDEVDRQVFAEGIDPQTQRVKLQGRLGFLQNQERVFLRKKAQIEQIRSSPAAQRGAWSPEVGSEVESLLDDRIMEIQREQQRTQEQIMEIPLAPPMGSTRERPESRNVGSRGSRQSSVNRQRYESVARAEARRAGVDEETFLRLVTQESNWNPDARSPVGAFGLTQIMPDTARSPGFGVAPLKSLKDSTPEEQLRFGAEYFAAMLRQTGGDYRLAAAAYNAGLGKVQHHRGVPPYRETQGYVKTVVG